MVAKKKPAAAEKEQEVSAAKTAEETAALEQKEEKKTAAKKTASAKTAENSPEPRAGVSSHFRIVLLRSPSFLLFLFQSSRFLSRLLLAVPSLRHVLFATITIFPPTKYLYVPSILYEVIITLGSARSHDFGIGPSFSQLPQFFGGPVSAILQFEIGNYLTPCYSND